MEYLQFVFEDVSQEKKEVLIAMLSEIGFDGFEEEGKMLKAFIPQQDIDQNSFDLIIELNDIKYSKSIIKETNWNAKWESDFEPVQVMHPLTNEPLAYIRANFHEADSSYLYDISVTPKMSFGTGHHATTHLMVAQMSGIDFTNKTVIDFGTGTGVLAILAEKMGAASILAIDCDDWSINNAKENLAVNNCSKTVLLKAETIPAGNKADIILANINLNIILANLSAIKEAMLPKTQILFSGIMDHDEENIVNALKNSGINIKDIYRRENWIAIYTVN